MKGLDMQELWQLCAIVDGKRGEGVYVSGRVFKRLQERGLVRWAPYGPACPCCGKRAQSPRPTTLGRWLRSLYGTGQIPMVTA